MAECAVTGQTVVSRHYAAFKPETGETRYYALASPPADDGQWKGTIQTMPASLEQVAEDIARTGESGALRWNPISIQTSNGYLKPQTMINIPITAGTPGEIEAQIRKGAPTRVTTAAEVAGRGVLNIGIDLDLWPPFAGM